MKKILIIIMFLQLFIFSCSKTEKKQYSDNNDIFPENILEKQIFDLEPEEINKYLSWQFKNEKIFSKRLKIIAEKQIGQPHVDGTTGEFPIEIPSEKTMYNLDESDCVTFVENSIALSMSDTWRSYFVTLQRIRYKNGLIGWESRNHFFEADWEKNNSWIIEDINSRLSKENLELYEQTVERNLFYSMNSRNGNVPDEKVKISYFHQSKFSEILTKLILFDKNTGKNNIYLFNLIRTNQSEKKWVGHIGFALVENDKVYIIHSRIPEVKKELFTDYMNDQLSKNAKRIKEKRPYIYGMRFFIIKDDPLSILKSIEGEDAPVITIKSR